MKRLQEGDECYVRNGKNELFSAKVVSFYDDGKGFLVFIPYLGIEQCLEPNTRGINYKGKTTLWSLVYPSEAIKRLAK